MAKPFAISKKDWKQMANFNQVTLVGHLTRDVEVKYLESGAAVGNTSIAVSKKYKKGGETVEKTCFVELTLWNKTAEIAAEYCGKGSAVLISGELEMDTWEKDGQKRSRHTITVNSLQMLGSKGDKPSGGESRGSKPQNQQSQNQYGQSRPYDDSIPF
jgi:single-strand DNA-binding protein